MLGGPCLQKNHNESSSLTFRLAIVGGLSDLPLSTVSLILLAKHSSAYVEDLLWDLNSRNTAGKDL